MGGLHGSDVPVTSWSDEVQEDMDAIVPESRVTLDTRFLCQDVIVLSLEVSNNL